jgi:hypothetical protein
VTGLGLGWCGRRCCCARVATTPRSRSRRCSRSVAWLGQRPGLPALAPQNRLVSAAFATPGVVWCGLSGVPAGAPPPQRQARPRLPHRLRNQASRHRRATSLLVRAVWALWVGVAAVRAASPLALVRTVPAVALAILQGLVRTMPPVTRSVVGRPGSPWLPQLAIMVVPVRLQHQPESKHGRGRPGHHLIIRVVLLLHALVCLLARLSIIASAEQSYPATLSLPYHGLS